MGKKNTTRPPRPAKWRRGGNPNANTLVGRGRMVTAEEQEEEAAAAAAAMLEKAENNGDDSSAKNENNNGGKNGKGRNGKNKNGKNGGGEESLTEDFSYFPEERRALWPVEWVRAAPRPLTLVPRKWRDELPHIFIVFLAVLIIYFVTTPRQVALEDDGLFLLNMQHFGVAHPPGYPLHTFLGGIFYHVLTFFSIDTPAFRGHFFSGFAAAVGCAALYAAVSMIIRGRIFGYLAGIGYGVSHTFWSQAIIAEVYTLNAAVYCIVLALCVKFAAHRGGARDKSHFRLYCVIAFVFALGVSNHMPLLGLASVGLTAMVLSQWRNILTVKKIAAGAVCLAAGLLPYAWMVARSHSDTIASFYGPLDTFQDFLFYVGRKGYSGVDTQANVGLEDKIAFSKYLGWRMSQQFTVIGASLAALGFFTMLRSRYNYLALCLFATWFCSGPLLIILLDFRAEYIWFSAFRVYPLVSYAVMAVWMAVGAAWLCDRLRMLSPLGRRTMAGAACMALLIFITATHWEENNRRDYRWAYDLAHFKLTSLEPNAAYFTFDDLDVPLMYLRYGENVRPDVDVFNDQGLVLGNRLFRPLIPNEHPDPRVETKKNALQRFVSANAKKRPIYYHPQRVDLYRTPNFGSDFMGFMRRVNPDGPEDRIILSDALRVWLDKNLAPGLRFTDDWTRHQHYGTVATLVNAIVLASTSGFSFGDAWRETIARARERNLTARIISNMYLIPRGQMEDEELEREWKWSETVDFDDHPQAERRAQAYFFQMRALIASVLFGINDERVEQNLAMSFERSPTADNQVWQQLLDIYFRGERDCDYLDLVERVFPEADGMPTPVLRQTRSVRRRGCFRAG